MIEIILNIIFILLCLGFVLCIVFFVFALGYSCGVGACWDKSYENIAIKFIKDTTVEPDMFDNILSIVPDIDDCIKYTKKSFKEWCKECLEKIRKQ